MSPNSGIPLARRDWRNSKAPFVRIAAFVAMLAVAAASRAANPQLSLVDSTTGLPIRTITAGTSSISLDVRLNSGGNTFSGLSFYLTVSSGVAKYTIPSITALDNPFTATDVQRSPAGGSPLQASSGTFDLFKFSAGDYAAVSGNNITRHVIDTSALPGSLPGTSYTFTPVGTEMTGVGAGSNTTTFLAPTTFTLTVVPEPTMLGAMALTGAVLLIRRRRRIG